MNLKVERAREARALLTAGDVTGLTVGIAVRPNDVQPVKDGGWIFRKAKLSEVSIVAIPADTEARVSTVANIQSIREFERFLREAGFARQFAAKIASRGWPKEGVEQSEIQAAVQRIEALTARRRTLLQGR